SLWSVSYLAQLDPRVAREQYTAAQAALGASILGVGGFREWPRGRDAGMDLDSGPVVFGIGMAATGLGLGAARLFRDEARCAVIRRTELMFGVPAPWPSGGLMTAPLLGEAILFDGRAARPWFADVTPVAPEPPPAPIAPLLLTLIDAAIVAAL